MLSPANCNFDGTIAALRDARIKKTEIKSTERKTKRIGFVVYSLPAITGGRLKSFVLGGTNPSPVRNKCTRGTRSLLIGQNSREILASLFFCACGATLLPRVQTCEIQQKLPCLLWAYFGLTLSRLRKTRGPIPDRISARPDRWRRPFPEAGRPTRSNGYEANDQPTSPPLPKREVQIKGIQISTTRRLHLVSWGLLVSGGIRLLR